MKHAELSFVYKEKRKLSTTKSVSVVKPLSVPFTVSATSLQLGSRVCDEIQLYLIELGY